MAEMEVELPWATETGWWVAGLLEIFSLLLYTRLTYITHLILHKMGPFLPTMTT